MRSARGMGDITPSKMPGAKKKARKDNTDFTQYAKGGKVGKGKGGGANVTTTKGGGGGGAGTPKVGAKRPPEFKKGGKVKSASARADGCCVKGKTRA